ncbi:MAG TPA: hypothetical protein VFR17_04490 [Mycobacterium sp.]|nr:hypothetical protein [Mycobacterium sp.]
MSDEQQAGDPAEDAAPKAHAAAPAESSRGEEPPAGSPGRPMFSRFGWGSAVLGLLSVAAIVFSVITWQMHHSDVNERTYRTRVLQAAASWTSVLINLNAENVEKGMQRLHDKTIGPLNAEFEAAVQPYRDVVQRIQSRSTGRIEAVAIETLHNNLDSESVGGANDPGQQLPESIARRTDPVMVVATSIAQNAGGQAETVHWALELDVSDVDGQLLISKLRSIR